MPEGSGEQDCPWYKRPGVNTEQVFAAMRGIDADQSRYYEEHRRLSPPHGYRAVGGQHFDAFAAAEVRREFLSQLRKGKPPEVACAEAKKAVRYAVGKWNEVYSQDVHLQRPESLEDTTADHLRYRMIAAAS